MPAASKTIGDQQWIIQEAIGAYTDEAYTTQKTIARSGIAGADAAIDVSGETFVGQLRWRKPLTPVINVVSLTDATEGARTTQSSATAMYVKSVRSHGARQINMQEVISQQDGLAKIGRDFAQTRATDENNAVLSVLRGVAAAEVLYGASSASGSAGLGGQSFDSDPEDMRYGFYVDLGNSAKIVEAASASLQGAARAESFLKAIGMAWKDYEPEYLYASVMPEVLASLRTANLVETDGVVEGDIAFDTLFGGKIRLLKSRANMAFSSAEKTALNNGVGVDIGGTKTTFLILPNALAIENIPVPTPYEIERRAGTYNGGGNTDIWYRWGYVIHPRGYSWNGAQDVFASDADYKKVGDSSSTMVALSGATVGASTKGTFLRKTASALSLSILPVFHG